MWGEEQYTPVPEKYDPKTGSRRVPLRRLKP